MSERRSCAALGVGRSSIRYRSTKSDQASLRMRICDLAKSRVRYGYFRVYILLSREGWRVDHTPSGCGRSPRNSPVAGWVRFSTGPRTR